MKYLLLKDSDNTKVIMGVSLYRIQYLRDVGDWIKEGSLGGYIEKESCLSQDGESFVGGNAYVFGDSEVVENGKVYGRAWIQGKSIVRGNASVFDNATIYNSIVEDNAKVFGSYLLSMERLQSNNTRVTYG